MTAAWSGIFPGSKKGGTALLNCASSKKDRTAVLCTSEFSRDVRTLKERFANIFSGGGKKRGVFVVVVGVLLVLSASLFVMFGASENGFGGFCDLAGNVENFFSFMLHGQI